MRVEDNNKNKIEINLIIEEENLLTLIKRIIYGITLLFGMISIAILIVLIGYTWVQSMINASIILFTIGMLWLTFKIKRKESLNKQDNCKHNRNILIPEGKYLGGYKCLDCDKIITEQERGK